MQFTKVNLDKIDQLPFIKESVINDGQIQTLTLEIEGKLYLVSSMFSISFSEQKPDVIEKRFKVSGNIKGIEIKPFIVGTEYEADKLTEVAEHGELKYEEIEYNVTKNGQTQQEIDDLEILPF